MLSIITPVLNGSQYIIENIKSIMKLTIPYEHIIVDGGSTDGTIELIKQYPHVKLLSQSKKDGMYGAIQEGFKQSQGTYLTWINCDDLIIPFGYECMFEQAIKHSWDLIYSNSIYHYKEKFYYKKIFAKHFCKYFLKEGIMPFVQPSVIFSKVIYDKVGGLNVDKFRIIGDRDLFQRIAYDKSVRFKYIPVFSSVFLQHSGSLYKTNSVQIRKEWAFVIKSNLTLFNRVIFRLSQLYSQIVHSFSDFN